MGNSKKYIIALQAMAFIKCYVKLSGTSPVSLYNFARALHFLGLLAPAEMLYRKIIDRIRMRGTGQDMYDNAVLRYAALICPRSIGVLVIRSLSSRLSNAILLFD